VSILDLFSDLQPILPGSGSALVLINELNLRRARLVLGWVTVSGFNSGHVRDTLRDMYLGV